MRGKPRPLGRGQECGRQAVQMFNAAFVVAQYIDESQR
jgi:hypothetical protein